MSAQVSPCHLFRFISGTDKDSIHEAMRAEYPKEIFNFSRLLNRHDWVDALVLKLQVNLVHSWVDGFRVKSIYEIADGTPTWFQNYELLRKGRGSPNYLFRFLSSSYLYKSNVL